MMLERGIKASTTEKYMDNFQEFANTMHRRRVPKSFYLQFPTPDFCLVLYGIDCGVMRENAITGKPNAWNTIRNKYASIDHVNKLACTPTSWSQNPALCQIIDYCKRNNKSDPSITSLPFLPVFLERNSVIP